MAAIDGKTFATRQGAGRTDNERSGGSVGGCRRPVPHSADGGLAARNYRSNGSARDGRGPQRAAAGREWRSQGRACHSRIIKQSSSKYIREFVAQQWS